MISARALHGALLAIISAGLAVLLWPRQALIRWLALPLVGWVTGWVSSVPIAVVLFSRLSGSVLLWPFGKLGLGTLVSPYLSGGLVSVVWCGLLICHRPPSPRSIIWHLLAGTTSGVLGSLPWWLFMFKPWYFSPLHGTIWGSLVGFGVWKSQRAPTA